MSFEDQFGLDLSTESEEAAAAFCAGLDLALANHVGARTQFLRALELDPTFAMAHVALAVQDRHQGVSGRPARHVLLARRHVDAASRRERQVVHALRASVAGDWANADRLVGEHLDEFPRDVLLVREQVLLRGLRGAADRKARLAADLRRLAPYLGDDPWFAGALSLALSEIGEVAPAVEIAQRALALRPAHAGVAHSLAHTYYEQGDDAGARDFLGDWLDDHGTVALNAGHLTWHLALAHIALGEPDHAVALHARQKSATGGQGFAFEDRVSLLWRLRIRGVDLDDEWKDVLAQPPGDGPVPGFRRAHVAYALAATGDVDALHALRRVLPEQPFVGGLIDALTQLALGDWAAAAQSLDASATDVRRLGGSNEQHALIGEVAGWCRLQTPRAART